MKETLEKINETLKKQNEYLELLSLSRLQEIEQLVNEYRSVQDKLVKEAADDVEKLLPDWISVLNEITKDTYFLYDRNSQYRKVLQAAISEGVKIGMSKAKTYDQFVEGNQIDKDRFERLKYYASKMREIRRNK